MGTFLNERELQELTRRTQGAAQARVCVKEGIPHRIDPGNGRVLINAEELHGFLMGAMTELYRHFDRDGTLLYVGISLSAIRRTSQHKTSGWWMRVSRIDIERHPTREKALEAERVAIQTEKPLFNIANKGGTGIKKPELVLKKV